MPGDFYPQEHAAIDHLDFSDYDDSIIRSIHEWEQSGKHWSGKVRAFFHAATVQGRPEPAGQRLIDATQTYADSFENAATQVATDSVVPEMAVQALKKLILADDTNRRSQLRKTEPMLSIPKPSQRYVRELAHAYGDPDGVLLPLDTPHEFDPTTLARMSFIARLEDQADVILGNLRTIQPDRHTTPSYDTSRAIARRAFGRYSPAADQ